MGEVRNSMDEGRVVVPGAFGRRCKGTIREVVLQTVSSMIRFIIQTLTKLECFKNFKPWTKTDIRCKSCAKIWWLLF
jgi:hypothetical protein